MNLPRVLTWIAYPPPFLCIDSVFLLCHPHPCVNVANHPTSPYVRAIAIIHLTILTRCINVIIQLTSVTFCVNVVISPTILTCVLPWSAWSTPPPNHLSLLSPLQHCPRVLLLFSVLGMFLFGGKFCIRADGSGDCTCREILDPGAGCKCTRMHFNNFLWATVTVFQVSQYLDSFSSTVKSRTPMYLRDSSISARRAAAQKHVHTWMHLFPGIYSQILLAYTHSLFLFFLFLFLTFSFPFNYSSFTCFLNCPYTRKILTHIHSHQSPTGEVNRPKSV